MNAGGVDRAEALRNGTTDGCDINSNHLLRTNDMNRLDLGKLDRGVILFVCLLLFD